MDQVDSDARGSVEDGTQQRRVFLGLGSNLGDRVALLREAIESLKSDYVVKGISPLYETEPMGGPIDQPSYLNLVVELETLSSPRELLALCQRLEDAASRVRTVRFGPRTLDVDILLVGSLTVDEHDLKVPHPRMWDRKFVLVPLCDLAPELVPKETLARAGGEVVFVGML